MRSVRNLLLLAVVTILAWTVVGSSAFAQSFTPAPLAKDTVFNGVVGDDANKFATRLLIGTFSGLAAGDSLSSVTVKSCTQKEFAMNRIRLYKKAGATATAIGNYTVTGRFDENFEATIAGINTPFANGDTLVISFDAWTDSVDTDTTYHETGLELVIPDYGFKFRNAGVVDSLGIGPITNPGAFRASFDAAACNPNPSGEYTRIFDLYAPAYNVAITIYDTTTAPNSCTNMINIGDSLFILVSNPNEEVKSNSVKVNLSAFGGSAAHVLNYHANGAGFADDTWTDTVRVYANGTDVIPGLVISFAAEDNAGNTGNINYQFLEAIDDIAPQIDSVKFYISQNNVGSDTSAAVGDRLTLIAYMTSNGYFEIQSVIADFSNFRTDSLAWTLDDVTNGNGIFRRDIWLTNEMARDIAKGSNPLKYVLITGKDNACNQDTFTVNFDLVLDLDPPVFSSIVYRTITNADSSSCTNLGDSIRVTTDLSGSPDIASVWSNFLDGGLGGATNEALGSIGSGNWEKRWKIGNLYDVNFDPNPIDAKDLDSAPIDFDFTVWVYAVDDAGNRDSLQSGAVEAVLGGGTPLDTRRPTAVDQDAVNIMKLPGAKIRLAWPTSMQATDAQYFYVYVDSTGAGFNYNSIFGTTFSGEYVNAGPDSNAWTSEVLTDGQNYKFVIRTEDNCGNWEFNTNIFEAIPDGTPPTVCIVFPATGGNYGPNNPVDITATTSDSDVNQAWAVWRKKDRGDGTPGAWQNYAPVSNYMSNPGGGLTFLETLNLGTDPSTEGVWQVLILSNDDVGNVQTLAGAESDCGFFEFNWNPNVPVCDFLTINGAFAPQSPCGYEVSRTEMNTANITVTDPAAEPVYTVDSWVIFTTSGDRTRVDYADDQSLPYDFQFWVGDWPKTVGGPLPTYLITEITDTRNGSICVDSVRLCLPDEVAPVAYISYPDAYQCVQKAQSSLNSVEVEIAVSEIGFDQSSPIRAELFYSLDGTMPGTKIGEEAFGGEDYVSIDWDNSNIPEGYVWLYAVVYDDQNNSYTTPWVKICIDGTLPEMNLTVKGAVQYACNGENKWRVAEDLETPIYLAAELKNFTNIDIANVYFFVQPIGNPSEIDVFHFWELLGQGEPANNNSIWTYEWNSDDGNCGYDYRIRVAVEDNAGNWMLDMDGDGNFDDYTFDDAMDAGAGMVIYFDCSDVEPAYSLFETTGDEGTRTWTNPSDELGGSGDVYAKPGETIRVQVMTIPADDSCEVAKVEYFFDGIFVGSSSNATNWWEVSFNPLSLGLITLEDVANGYVEYSLEARLWDKLGQTDSDYLDVFILDPIPDQALITEPGDGEYVCGQTQVDLAIFDGRDLKRVTWFYWPLAGGPKVKIADVWADQGYDESGPMWSAYWNIALNNPPNGDYYLGAELCDISDNITAAEESKILVHVNCSAPSITLTQPGDGGFFCDDEYFCATVNVNGGAPIDNVTFQFKLATASPESWQDFDNNADREAPWCASLDDDGDIESEGFYHFRAVVTNDADIVSYSDVITLFYDNTAPMARPIWVTDGVDTFDVENANDPTPMFKVGTKKLTFKFRAKDDQSPWGPSPLYNSGLGSICANNVCVDITADEEGYFIVEFDMSGESPGEWSWGASISDAVGCNESSVYIDYGIYAGDPTLALVAGCWDGKLFGIAEYDASTIFQYRQGSGNWIQISSNNEQDGEWLLNDDWSYTPEMWSVHYTDWVPANGTYQVRLLSDNGYGSDESLSPIVTISVTATGCEVTGAPADFGPGTIERNLENDCDNLEGLAQIGSGYGMPYGVAVSYNVPREDWDFEIIPFTALNQQGGITRYSGAFHYDALVYDGGFGEGRTYFVDYNGTTGWSTYQMYNTFWVTRDYGTGGPVTFMDVTVDIPAEWTDNTGHDETALAIWKSKLARPSIYEDWVFTPVGDNNGMMTYITDPSCEDNCGDDDQYAIVKMQYNNTVTTPSESLMVAYWDGEGEWEPYNIYFPSTVRGFFREGGQNWVEFAVTCFGDGDDGWYSVVKRTKYDGDGLITRMQMVPYCDPYTDGYPDIWYQLSEPFQYQINWNTLEVYFDDVRIFARSWYQDGKTEPKSGDANQTALDEASPQWSFWVDEVSAQLHIRRNTYGEYNGPDSDSYDSDSYYPPITCGAHTVYVRVEDEQLRPQFIRDQITVDCTAPDVDFANGYVTMNPTITFTIDDEGSGVSWDDVHVDVYFVTKMDTTDGGPDGSNPKERMAFIQTFFPAQIQDYLQSDGRTVIIPTTYDLDDERGLYVVVFDGSYSQNYDPDNDGYYYCYYGDCGDPSAWDNFDQYYGSSDGVQDCVGNNTTPHVQFFVVDREGATITLQNEDDACPLIFNIADDGSGMETFELYENGVKVTRAAQANAGAVDAAGEWYFAASGSGGTFYYCPANGVSYEIRVADNTGAVSSYFGAKAGSFSDGDVTGWAGPNPFDPEIENFSFNVKLEKSADNVIIRVFNMAGEHLKTINYGAMSAGEHAVAWDGRTDGGTMVADGGYIAEVTASGKLSSAFTVIRFAVVEK